MILHIRNPKDATRKFLELIIKYSKLQDIKLIHRNLLYTNNERPEREIKETISFTISTIKKNKIFRNKIT